LNSRGQSRALGLVVELLVVFLGVAIALTADAWWERQEEHARARAYMESLLADLEAAGPPLRAVIEENEARQEDLELGFEGGAPIPLRAAQGSADMAGAFLVHGQVLLGNANLTRSLLESSERISAELTRVLSGAR
jgi:hypothetical protein